jgi:hypothetical protein
MFRTRIALAAAVVAATAVPAVAFAGDRSTSSHRMSSCEGMTERQAPNGAVLSNYPVVSVAPYVYEWTPIKTTLKEIRGATVRIEARPGLTAEWLQLRLERQIAALQSTQESAQAADSSPLAMPGVRAMVSSAPDGFLITLVAPDKGSGEEVLQRARSLAVL